MSEAISREPPKQLLLGYGNPGRRDDGLGPAAAARIAQMEWSGVAVVDPYQLSIEDALDITAHDIIWFVDATRTGPEPFELRRLAAKETIEFDSHNLDPATLLALAMLYFGRAPEAWLLGVRGYEFDFSEGLSQRARANLDLAVALLAHNISERMGTPR
ncbi:MAG: hydrogenase maturation protease [Methylocystis sp.]|jgi:hydrogenase maturation protease